MDIGYVKTIGILLSEELKTIPKKNKPQLQPIFEALTNSFEAIQPLNKGVITITIFKTKDLFTEKDGKSVTEKYFFDKITVTDNGIGFNSSEFKRLSTLRDNTKNFNNKGTGRIQFLHYFEETIISSTYKDPSSSTKYKNCEFVLSKSNVFLNEDAIIRVDKDEEIQAKKTSTTLTFKKFWDTNDADYYVKITSVEIKELIIKYFLDYFCENRTSLPKIKIQVFVENAETSSAEIKDTDIPYQKFTEPFTLGYSRLVDNKIVSTSKNEAFSLKIFLIEENKLPNNGITITSKGAIAQSYDIDCLLSTEKINGYRYLVLVSGNYIDKNDSDARGDIKLLTDEKYREQNKDTLFPEEIILLDDIIKEANNKIRALCPEIAKKYDEKQKGIEELKEMFLLDEQAINDSNIKFNDTDEVILRKVYEADAKVTAKKDAAIKKIIDEVEKLDPKDKENYHKELQTMANKFVKIVPLQNRNELALYIARRRIVLEWFDKILKNEIDIVSEGNRIAEDVLHNFIFRQHSTNPENSELWLINEEFIYFQGTSESLLKDLELDGQKIFKDEKDLTQEELDYRLKQGGDANLKRTDILLFPKEEKCIIIELKAPDINVTEHLNQINRYASLIYNLSKKEYNFTSFYGYLIGENIDIDDIRDNDSDFRSAANFDYVFRPHKNIVGKFRDKDASLYTEVIKYSTLLERAKLRNKIFIDKLEKGKNTDNG